MKKNISLYLSAQFFSLIGDHCSRLALSWWILEQTHSVEYYSWLISLQLFIRIIFIPLFGPLGDRFSKRKIILFSDFFRFLLTTILLIIMLTQSFSLIITALLLSLTSLLTALFDAGAFAILPDIASNEKEMAWALKQHQGVVAMSNIVGAAFAGLLIATCGVKMAIAVDALTFFLSGILCLKLHPYTKEKKKESKKAFLLQLKEGLSYLISRRTLLYIVCMCMYLNFMFSYLMTYFPILIKEIYHAPVWALSNITISIGIGSVLATFLSNFFCKQIKNYQIILFSLLGLSVGTYCFQLGANGYFILLGGLLLGLSVTSFNIPVLTCTNLETPDHLRARVMSLILFFCQLVSPLGGFLVGKTALTLSPAIILTFFSTMTFCCLPILYFLFPNITTYFELKSATNLTIVEPLP